MSDVPDEPSRRSRKASNASHRPRGTIVVSYETDVGSENRSATVRVADLTDAERTQLLVGLTEHADWARGGPRAVFSSLVVEVGGVRFGTDPRGTPTLFAFARRALGGPGTFGNDPGW